MNNSSILNHSVLYKSFTCTQYICQNILFKSQTVLFQAIQFSINTQLSSICPKDRTLSGSITPGPSGPGSDGKGELHLFPQSFSITTASPSDCLVSYRRHSLGGESFIPLQRDSWCILQPQPTVPSPCFIYEYVIIAFNKWDIGPEV